MAEQGTADGIADDVPLGVGHGVGQAPAHETGHGQDDATVAEHQRTFAGFVQFWVYVFGATFAILIFLALFNS